MGALHAGNVGDMRTDAEVLALIQYLADMPNLYSRPYLAHALSCLAKRPGFQPAVGDAALQALSTLLQQSVLESASASLARAAVPALNGLMQSTSCVASGLLAAFAMVLLVSIPEVQLAIAEAGLPGVIHLLQGTGRPAGQALAANVLAISAGNVKARAHIAQTALPALVTVLRTCPANSTIVLAGIMTTLDAALCALSLLTFTFNLRASVADAALGALVSIIQDSKQPTSDCRIYAVCVLEHLSGHWGLQQRIADAALPGLLKLMQGSSTPEERLKAVEAVSSLALCWNAQLRHQIQAAAHADLVLLARQKMDSKSRKAARRALRRLRHSQLSCWGIW